jgi:hypothetical protein
MNTYRITAKWGPMELSEEMDITSDFGTDMETEYCKNHVVSKWTRLFGNAFIEGADEITTTKKEQHAELV